MTSEKQIEANRSNAQLSTGPTTEEGKRRCSLNARRHGLTGQVTSMTDEDRAAHDAFSAAMIKDLAPDGAVETQLAQRIATDSWRLNRISAIEDNIFALGFFAHAAQVDIEHPEAHAALTAAITFEAESKQLERLSLYEQRLNRAVQKNLAILQDLQAKRKAERQHALEEVTKLCQLSEKKGLQHEHAANGFVFSNEEIRAAIDRKRRLDQAERFADRRDFRHHRQEKPQAKAA